jgi:hypothetical protein
MVLTGSNALTVQDVKSREYRCDSPPFIVARLTFQKPTPQERERFSREPKRGLDGGRRA